MPESGHSLPGVIGGYALLGRLGRGGMGEVFLARKEGTHGFSKTVAIKVLLPTLISSDSHRSMFLHEVRIAARLNHPNVCQVFDFGEQDGLFYLAMEHLEGVTLAQLVTAAAAREETLAPGVVAHIVAGAARGLHHAHVLKGDHGQPLDVVHRDVSSQNIFITYDGAVKVLDFGIAKSIESSDLTSTGHVRGKAAYHAPEQLRDEPVDGRTDVFALGVVLWEALTGRRLFKRDSAHATHHAVMTAMIPDPREHNSAVPVEMIDVIRRALARNIGERLESAGEMARLLDEAVRAAGAAASQESIAASLADLFPPDSRPGPEPIETVQADSSRRRRRWATPAAAAIALVALASVPFLLSQEAGAPASEPSRAPPAATEDASTVDEVTPTVEEPEPAEGLGEPAVSPSRGASAKKRRPSKRKRKDRSSRAPAAEPSAAPTTPPATGAITIVADPYGEVWIDGVARGSTPVMKLTLPAGAHRVQVKSPVDGSIRYDETVDVAADGVRRVVVR